MDIDVLKSISQCLRLIHALAIFMMLLRHDEFFIISLRCLQDSLSGLGVESLLYLWMDDNNSSFKKGGHLVGILSGIFSNNETSTC